MADDPASLLRCARQEAGYVDEGEDREVELVAGPVDGVPVEPREPDDDVLGPVLLDLEELAVVDDDPRDHVAHVIRHVRAVWQEQVEVLVGTPWVVERLAVGRVLQVVRRQEGQEVLRSPSALAYRRRRPRRDP